MRFFNVLLVLIWFMHLIDAAPPSDMHAVPWPLLSPPPGPSSLCPWLYSSRLLEWCLVPNCFLLSIRQHPVTQPLIRLVDWPPVPSTSFQTSPQCQSGRFFGNWILCFSTSSMNNHELSNSSHLQRWHRILLSKSFTGTMCIQMFFRGSFRVSPWLYEMRVSPIEKWSWSITFPPFNTTDLDFATRNKGNTTRCGLTSRPKWLASPNLGGSICSLGQKLLSLSNHP